MTEALAVINEEEQYQPGTPSMSTASNTEKAPSTAQKHPQGFPKNIERMFETFHQTPSGEFKPTFYNPFEIKHRRRTSRDQFQVLESSFQENSKPNATVRRALAQRLGMTPRAVQVWFQNRRAKLKTTGNPNGPMSEMSEAPDSPQITSADASTQCSSLASPDHMASIKPAKVAKKGLGRRHSMPNMAQSAPIITNEHFKQLHEAIFGGHMMTPHLSQHQQNLNYQVPMKPLHSQSYDQGGYIAPPSYYPPGFLPPGQHMHSPQVQKTRAPSMAYGNPMMGLDNPNMDPSDSPMANDLDYFLQSIIIPQGNQQQQQQQQMFLSSLMQSDPAQIPGMTENLASFLCAGAPSGHGEVVAANGAATQQQNDSYLLSKYMNDERFAD